VVKNYPDIEVLDTQPADWDVSKVARIWETLLTKYPEIDAAFFHNDDMALAAAEVMKRQNRTNILLGGVDAMPPAITAVAEGRMHATVRNPPRASMATRSSRAWRPCARREDRCRHPEKHRHRRPGGHKGQRGRHAVDAEPLPDLSGP
jgi:hypothetical protein